MLIRQITRRAIPLPLKLKLVSAIDVALQCWKRRLYRKRTHLQMFPSLLPVVAFDGGPIVLCNNALAWGGVERQIVNTLRGLDGRTDRALKLLCLRLGEEAAYDFYLPALRKIDCEVRNVATLVEAKADITQFAGTDALNCIHKSAGWLPSDVYEKVLRFAGDFARLKPSVVHAWQDEGSLCAGIAARLIGVPRVVVSSRNMAARRFQYHRAYMADAYREIASCESIVMLNNSEAGARDYSEWLGIPPARYQIIRNGVDADTIRKPAERDVQALRARLGLATETRVVGSIFRFYAEKRPELWIETACEVARRLPDCHFVIFGDGPMKQSVAQAARNSGFENRLHLPGTIDDVASALASFDVFLLTSELEGTPNVVLESSLLGVPVVATDAGGTRETIRDGVTGYVVVAQARALADKIVAVIDDDKWRAQARHTGPTFVNEQFGLKRMIDETLRSYSA